MELKYQKVALRCSSVLHHELDLEVQLDVSWGTPEVITVDKDGLGET